MDNDTDGDKIQIVTPMNSTVESLQTMDSDTDDSDTDEESTVEPLQTMDSDTDGDIYSDIDEDSTVEPPQPAETETCQFSRSGLEGWVMDEPLPRKLSVKHQSRL